LRTRAIPERLRGVFTTRCYIHLRLTLPFAFSSIYARLLTGRQTDGQTNRQTNAG